MRVVTWNLGYWQFRRRHAEAWEYLRNEIKPDIALLQETCPREMGDDEILLFEPVHGGWGTAIYSTGLQLTPVGMTRYPGRVVAAKIDSPGDGSAYVASIHAPIINGRVFPHLDRILDDVESAFGASAAIFGGDLNSARLAEQVWPGNGHGPFFERLESGPWVDCHWRLHRQEIQTFFRQGQVHPFQDDHLFVSADLAPRVLSCRVIHNEITRRVSDHIPVVAEISD